MENEYDEEEDAFFSEVEKLDLKLEKGEILTGKEAAMILACMFGNSTHGNYEGDILYYRTKPEEEYEITLKKINRGKNG